jgi:hypothetical protein
MLATRIYVRRIRFADRSSVSIDSFIVPSFPRDDQDMDGYRDTHDAQHGGASGEYGQEPWRSGAWSRDTLCWSKRFSDNPVPSS